MRSWIVFVVVLLSGCAGLGQREDQVFKRVSGGQLEPWVSAGEASSVHWPFAWAAVASYQDADDPKRKPLETTADCPNPEAFLIANHWTLWDELPLLRQHDEPDSVGAKMRAVHLRAEVWSNAQQGRVVVAFGGTAASSLEDWKSNLRWLLAPFHPEDAYSVLSASFMPAFMSAYRARSEAPGGGWLRTAQLVSTGHSLGGGLAQRFAYALRRNQGVPAVHEIFAFDPSPVSGKRESEDWQEAAKGLTINRIYNRGEFLASLRSIFNLYEDPPQDEGQTWIDIRYRDGWSWQTLLPSGSVHAHSMFKLACFMKQHAAIPASSSSASKP